MKNRVVTRVWRVILPGWIKGIIGVYCLGGHTQAVLADAPRMEALFPAGGQKGSSFEVSVTGKVGAECRLWTNAPGVFFMPTGRKQEWRATVSDQTKPGLYLVRAINDEGASEPRWFSIGSFAEMLENEPNDELGKSQEVTKLPICINGRLDKGGDVDGYAVRLDAGQTLTAVVEAYALGSGVDMLAHVIDEKGIRVLTASDGRNLDPSLAFKAPAAGLYTVQLAGFAHPPVADVRFTGGASVVYRLHLTRSAVATHLFPPVVSRQGKHDVTLAGPDIPASQSKYSYSPNELQVFEPWVQLTPPAAVLPLQAVVTSEAPILEKEPNDSREQATSITTVYASGVIQTKGDVDRYAVEMKKGQKLQARIWAKQLGLPLDAIVSVETPDGKVMTSSDDVSELNRDPLLTWTATSEGQHQIVVEDLMHQGSAQHAYVLEVRPPEPDFQVDLVDVKALLLEAGKTVSLKAKIKRLNGFKAPLVVRASGLPVGVHAPDVTVPDKDGEVELKIHAAVNAPASGQPIQVEVWTGGEGAQMHVAQGALRGENQRGTSLLDTTSQVWVTVKPKRD
ncbi:hypothetical protein SAMN02745166_04473 [Prosthecobacter debontii]|uniref:Pre-peptidase C-terminal domain-containing protein n=1 Tax=Prosthecobacter debontii TaxID=48467 RepID=A0A1T4YXZ2_9BACT|nr:PPC domain-containing protein [Prosthecobacter debontii]SKB06428.1 hypothetical protein SAMN02745166_04473 [Prosthecobacter debontii]